MPPFAVQQIDHLVLRVRDLERSVAFYQAALGCGVVRWREDLGLVHLRAGRSMIDLVSVDGPLGRRGGHAAGAEGRNLDHLCLRIEPFDEAALSAHLTSLAAPPHAAAVINFGAEGEGPSIYFSDPDGNVVELKGPSLPGSDAAPGPR
jgi:catechol 2,3-dioxygenase-like lactoylglutathione lyase family enzyme